MKYLWTVVTSLIMLGSISQGIAAQADEWPGQPRACHYHDKACGF